MNDKPSLEEAKKDLEVIKREIVLLRLIIDSARELSTHDDMDATHYRRVADKAAMHLQHGTQLESHIKTLYNL